MSKRTTKAEAESAPATRRRAPAAPKVAAAPEAPAPTAARARRKTASTTEISQAPDSSPSQNGGPSYDAIATRAYFIALEHGFVGDPMADWLMAEQQLRQVVS